MLINVSLSHSPECTLSHYGLRPYLHMFQGLPSGEENRQEPSKPSTTTHNRVLGKGPQIWNLRKLSAIQMMRISTISSPLQSETSRHSREVLNDSFEWFECLVMLQIYLYELTLSLCPSVVVVFAFFFLWLPYHTQRWLVVVFLFSSLAFPRLMFVMVTLHGDWSSALLATHHHLFIVSGKPL